MSSDAWRMPQADEAHAFEREKDPTGCWCPCIKDIGQAISLCCPQRATGTMILKKTNGLLRYLEPPA